jgi:hypothetical protein
MNSLRKANGPAYVQHWIEVQFYFKYLDLNPDFWNKITWTIANNKLAMLGLEVKKTLLEQHYHIIQF